jgi:hypothetical protein
MVAGPLFPLGVVVATPGALKLLEEHGTDPGELLARHASGDWGDLEAEDRKMNDRDLREGGRLFGAYDVPPSRLWIITEADRNATTFVLPDEY